MQRTLPPHPPPITAYLFHLYPLSILAQDNAYLPWLYSTHIQLFNFPSEELKFYTHPFCTPTRCAISTFRPVPSSHPRA